MNCSRIGIYYTSRLYLTLTYFLLGSVSLFPGKSKIRETGCGKFFSREIPSRLSRQFPDFKRLRQTLVLSDPLICCNPKCIILSLTQRLKFIYFLGAALKIWNHFLHKKTS